MVAQRTIDPYSQLDLSVFLKVGYLDQLYVFTYLKSFVSLFFLLTFWSHSSTLTFVLTMSFVDGPYQVHCT
jgi:hypothetical protein